MSQKRKSGLQRGLADIVEKQTAPVEDKSRLSRGLIDKFAENKDVATTPTAQSAEGGRPIAPARDYMKVANSISREAVPAGLFPGSSKKLYDALYMRTRGAVVSVKRAQATRRELSKWSGIKNIKTIAAHLRHLNTVGLVSSRLGSW